jgi:hypothetical protein
MAEKLLNPRPSAKDIPLTDTYRVSDECLERLAELSRYQDRVLQTALSYWFR